MSNAPEDEGNAPDPEDDFDAFMDSLPMGVRNKVLGHLGDEETPQGSAQRQREASHSEAMLGLLNDPYKDAESAQAFFESYETAMGSLLDKGEKMS